MGHKIRKFIAERDVYYELGGLIEMGDTYFGSSKPDKRGRGAGGKTTVVVAVEIEDSKPRFATMRQVGGLSAVEINSTFSEYFQEDWVVRTDGWPAYGIFNSAQGEHQSVVTGSGRDAVQLVPWVHTLIAYVKGNSVAFTTGSAPNILVAPSPNFAIALIVDFGNHKCLTEC